MNFRLYYLVVKFLFNYLFLYIILLLAIKLLILYIKNFLNYNI